MTARHPRRPALLLVAALLLASAAPAAAEGPRGAPGGKSDPDMDRDKARRHFERGQKLFSRLLFAEALEEYQAAFDAKAIPDFLFNIGQCHRNLGHYREAIFTFRRYLALVPEAEDRERVEALIAELEAEERKANGRKTTPPPPPPPGRKPVYTRWWFWTGLVVVAGGTAAVVIGTSGDGLPSTDLGNLDFPQ